MNQVVQFVRLIRHLPVINQLKHCKPKSALSQKMRRSEIFAQPKGGQSGFTLAELMIVIVIMGILGAMAIGSGFDRNKLVIENARKITERAFREARRLALVRGQPISILVFTNRVEVFQWDDLNRNRVVDWLDNNADGDFDAGEGEVVTAFGEQNYRIGGLEGIQNSDSGFVRIVSPTAGDITIPSLTLDFLCNQGIQEIAGADLFAARFMPNGVLLGADEGLCNIRLYVVGADGRVAIVNIDAGGQIFSQDNFG